MDVEKLVSSSVVSHVSRDYKPLVPRKKRETNGVRHTFDEVLVHVVTNGTLTSTPYPSTITRFSTLTNLIDIKWTASKTDLQRLEII